MIRNTSKGMIFMKKMLSVIIGMASVLFLHSGNVYAEMGEVYDMRLYGWYVTESDIYDLNTPLYNFFHKKISYRAF